MKIKFFVALLIALSIFSAADAAKVDIYRNAIQNQSFTLKYKITEFPIRITNREATLDLSYFEKKIEDQNEFKADYINTGGIMVFDKNNRYIENFHDAYKVRMKQGNETYIESVKEGGICTLKKNGEIFEFFWEMNDGAKKYYGSKSGGIFGRNSSQVRTFTEEKYQKERDKYANYLNPYEIMYNDYDYGNPNLFAALSVILPAEKIIAAPNIPVYKFVTSGVLDNGLSYEDFSDEKNGTFYAIRYYFSGDKMVKISTFNYTKSGGVIVGYEKHVIDIEEFSTAPDENYFELPAGVVKR